MLKAAVNASGPSVVQAQNPQPGLSSLSHSTLSPSTRNLWNSGLIQARLSFSSPSDACEQEADRVADSLIGIQTPIDPEDEKETHIGQRGETGAAEPSRHSVADDFARSLGSGEALNADTRGFFEPRFGHDFGNVRVHHNERAAESAGAIKSRAYTLGTNLVFGRGQYSPATTPGRRLLAHELTHVVQQGAGIAVAGTVYRSSVTPTLPAAPACYKRNDSSPPAGWQDLRNKAKGLPDVFNTYENKNSRFRNKAAAQYRVVLDTNSGEMTVNSDAIPYHSGNFEGSRVLLNALRTDPTPFTIDSRPTTFGKFFGSRLEENRTGEHNEALMHIYGIQMIERRRNLTPRIRMFEGYVFSFFAPCDDCQSELNDNVAVEEDEDPLWSDPNRVGKQWWVHSHCVDNELYAGGFDAGAQPVDPRGGNLQPGDPNYAQGRALKLAAEDALSDPGGWTKYTVEEDEDDQDQDETGGEEPPGGAVQDILQPIAIAAGALGLTAAVIHQAEKRGAQTVEETAVKKGATKGTEKMAGKQAAKVAGKAAAKSAQILSALALVYLLSRGEAKAAWDPTGDDPLIALLKSLSEKGDPVPEPLRTLIEQDAELRRLVEEAAAGGDLSAAQAAAAERASRILAENIDQFSDSEIEALLTAAGTPGPDSELIEPTLEQLKRASQMRRPAMEEAGKGGPAAGLPGEAAGSPTGAGAGGEAGIGAPAVLPGASENLQALWEAVTVEKGVPADDAFAKEFQQQIGNELSEDELNALIAIVKTAGAEPDPLGLLARLKTVLDELRATGEPSEETGGEAGEVTEGPSIERDLPLPSGGLDTESVLEELRGELSSRPPTDWPVKAGSNWLRRKRQASTSEIPEVQIGRLFARNADGRRCLQVVELQVIDEADGATTVAIIAASPLVCEQEQGFAASTGMLRAGKKYTLAPVP